MVVVPSAGAERNPGSRGSVIGTWARGIARLVARESGPGISAMAVLPIADAGGTVAYALADRPLPYQAATVLFEAYRPRYVVAIHVVLDGKQIEVAQTVWKEGAAEPVVSRKYPGRLGGLGGVLDAAADDLVRAVGGTPGPRGARVWDGTRKPESLEAFLTALDVGTLRAAARGRPLSGKPRETTEFLREALAADPGFAAARDLLADQKRRFDRVIISERKLPPAPPAPAAPAGAGAGRK